MLVVLHQHGKPLPQVEEFFMGPWVIPLIEAGGSILSSYLGNKNKGGGSDPSGAAMPYLNAIPSMLQGYYDPYINAGMGALPKLQDQYSQLMNGNFINNMGKNFQQSPGYQFDLNQQLDASNRAAAAGGYTGTPMAQQNSQTVAHGLADQDYNNWLNHAMNAYGMGLQGEQGLYNTGFQASNDLASDIATTYGNQANLAYAGQMNRNQAQGGGMGSMFGGLGSMLGGMDWSKMFGGMGGGMGGGASAGGGGGSGYLPWGGA
jgi:hypothetical protein